MASIEILAIDPRQVGHGLTERSPATDIGV